MKTKPLIAYFITLIILSATTILTIHLLGRKGMYFAQFYMLTPAIAAIVTRVFFYKGKFSDAFLKIGQARHWLQFWFISLFLAVLSYGFFTIFSAVTWDLSGQSFLDKLSEQFAQSGQTMEQTLPDGFTPQSMLLLYVIGNFTLFNILPGLITGLGEEFGHRGIMFKWLAEKNVKAAILLGGIFWFLWHLPLGLVMPVTYEFTPVEMVLNAVILLIGSICTHSYLAFVLLKTKSIWITAFAHIVFNNVSTALGFFVVIQNQTLANAGLVLTMFIAVVIGFWKFNFLTVLKSQYQKVYLPSGNNNSNHAVTRL